MYKRSRVADLNRKEDAMNTVYTRSEFLEFQSTLEDWDEAKHHVPRKFYVIVTDDGMIVDSDEEI